MNWTPYLTARARRAFPGVLLLRSVKDGLSLYLDKTVVWSDFMAYRGLVWEFGGGVTQNAYRVGYALGRYGTLTPLTRRPCEQLVSDQADAVRVIDSYYPELNSWLNTVRMRPVDGLPFEFHAICDLEARRIAGNAYLYSSLD